MPDTRRYCLDANLFIQAARGPYAMDIAPGFWEWLDRQHRTGRVYSSRSVYDELRRGDDQLAA